jgi:hypothetical protein
MNQNSAVYLYAITDEAHNTLPEMAGLDGYPLRSVGCRELVAVTSTCTNPAPHPTPDNVWCHERVVEALMARRAVLPMRFGSVLPDESHMLAVLDRHYAQLVSHLDHIAGRVELGLRVLCYEPMSIESVGKVGLSTHERTPFMQRGTAYLFRRLEEERRARCLHDNSLALTREIRQSLEMLAVDWSQEECPTFGAAGLLLSAAVLVDAEQADAFCAAAHALTDARPEMRLLITGPWPPYSFAQLELLGEGSNV